MWGQCIDLPQIQHYGCMQWSPRQQSISLRCLWTRPKDWLIRIHWIVVAFFVSYEKLKNSEMKFEIKTTLLSMLRLILFPHFSLTISFYWVIWCLLKYLLLLVLPPAYFVFKLFLYFMCLSLSFNLSESVCFSLSLSQYIFLFALSMSQVPI